MAPRGWYNANIWICTCQVLHPPTNTRTLSCVQHDGWVCSTMGVIMVDSVYCVYSIWWVGVQCNGCLYGRWCVYAAENFSSLWTLLFYHQTAATTYYSFHLLSALMYSGFWVACQFKFWHMSTDESVPCVCLSCLHGVVVLPVNTHTQAHSLWFPV